jgi:ribosomal protein S18 acetylase RimI-like enzyme
MGYRFSTQNVTLRPAIAADAPWASPLLFSAGPALFSYLFASPPEQAEEILQQAFVQPQHAFSYDHMQVAEVEGTAAGIFIGYPGRLKKQADEKVHFVMARLMPLRKLPKILVNVADFSRIKQEIGPDDYYVLGLSVVPELRGQGVGTYLLAQAEQQARASHCQTICGDVTYTNDRARRLLESRGYEITCSKTSDRFNQMTRAGGLHRMVKVLS